jgi:hypothetical protein
MTHVPEGAQYSDDHKWWWDGQQWQPVPDASGGTGAADPNDRSAARVAQGLPASLYDITDEQRRSHFAQSTVEVHPLNADQVEVVAMQDSGESMA